MEDFGENIDLDSIEFAYNQLLVSRKESNHYEDGRAVSKEKTILWKSASLAFYKGVEKMMVPFFLKKRIFRNHKTGKASFEGMSFFIVSKNEGKYEFEIMIRLSDNNYYENMDAFAEFSGLIIIEDIFGDFIKGYTVEEGQILGAVKKVECKTNEDCVTIEWYLFSDNGEMTLSEGLSHIEYYCPDSDIVPLVQDEVYTSIGRISRSIRERRYVHPELRERFKLITGNPISD